MESEFKKIDVDNDGFITLTEFKSLIRNQKENLSDNEIVALFNKIDLDGSGKITLDGIKILL